MLKPLLIAALMTTGGTQVAAQSLVGKWDCEGRKDRGSAVRSLMHYRTNGSFYHLVNVSVGDRRGRLDGAVAVQGKWQLAGTTLLEKMSAARMRSLAINGQDITRTPLGREIAKDFPREVGVGRASGVSRIKFTNARSFKLTSGATKATCTKR